MSSKALATCKPPLQVHGLPESWRSFRLGDVADISRGASWGGDNERRDPVDGALPVLGIRNVQARLEIDDLLWLHGLKPSAIASSTVQTGDILMVGSNGNPARIGNAVQVDEPGRYLYASLLFGLRPRREAVDPDFLYFAVVAPGVQTAISDAVQGTTGLSNLKITTLRDLPIDLPPLDEQRRIAEVLRSVDEAIAAQSTLCSHLRQTADDLADELYAYEIDACGSDLMAYGDACETVQVGIVIKPASYYVDDGGVHALRSTNITRNEIDFSALVRLSQEGHAINKKSALRAGDVVTIRTGEPGKTAVIPQDAPSPLNCIDIIFSRPKPELRPHFASYFINSGTARRQIGAMQGGLAQQHFNVGEMKKLKLPVPTLARQDRVIAVLDGAWRTVQLEEAQLVTLQSTKQALMSDLLCGRVRVPV